MFERKQINNTNLSHSNFFNTLFKLKAFYMLKVMPGGIDIEGIIWVLSFYIYHMKFYIISEKSVY